MLENKRLMLVRNTCCWINSEQSFDLYYDNIELLYVFVLEDKDEYACIQFVCLFLYFVVFNILCKHLSSEFTHCTVNLESLRMLSYDLYNDQTFCCYLLFSKWCKLLF